MPTSDAERLLQAEHLLDQALIGAKRLPDVAVAAIAAIGGPLGWQLGAGWAVVHEEMRLLDVWSDGSVSDQHLAAICAIDRLPRGKGLPGRVWADGRAAWVVEVEVDTNFPRRHAMSAAGMRSAFCFPIETDDGEVVGAIEFFTRELLEPDQRMLTTMASLGRRMGSVVERTLSERALQSSEATAAAILDASLDAIVTIEGDGRIVEFNPAAERTFGYTREEAVGREMAELIVPTGLRDRHRRGLERYLETGVQSLLDRRIEITARRRDGGEFPVELAVTRIGAPGDALFTGFIRDITDRKAAELEMRASRARVLEAADAARQRIERDLHDGAQQRLVSVALNLRAARSRMDNDAVAASELLDDAVEGLEAATGELRALARGIHPAVLSDRGLRPALTALAARSAVPVTIRRAPEDRLPQAVEAAVYFVVAEALTNVARYAQAAGAEVSVERHDGGVVAEVRDDGVGGADAERGSGLRGLADRVATLDGEFAVTSPAGGGTLVRAEIPCA
jgi:PAS domain S-box-containing protein